MRSLTTAISLLFSASVFAAPSQTPVQLMNNNVTSFAWGIHQLNEHFGGDVLTLARNYTLINFVDAGARYDDEDNILWLSSTAFGGKGTTVECEEGLAALRSSLYHDHRIEDDADMRKSAPQIIAPMLTHPALPAQNFDPMVAAAHLAGITRIKLTLYQDMGREAPLREMTCWSNMTDSMTMFVK